MSSKNFNLRNILEESQEFDSPTIDVRELLNRDPEEIIDAAKTQFSWKEIGTLIRQFENIDVEFASNLKAAQGKFKREIYKFYREGMRSAVLRLGFSKPNNFDWLLIKTEYGCGGLSLDFGGRPGFVKIACFRATASLESVEAEKLLPYGTWSEQVNWSLLSDDVSAILYRICNDWNMRKSRLNRIIEEIESRLVPTILMKERQFKEFRKSFRVGSKNSSEDSGNENASQDE